MKLLWRPWGDGVSEADRVPALRKETCCHRSQMLHRRSQKCTLFVSMERELSPHTENTQLREQMEERNSAGLMYEKNPKKDQVTWSRVCQRR